MALTTVRKEQLKKIKAIDFKEGDLIDIVDKNGEVVYTINISFGPYKSPLKTTVSNKNYELLDCTPGVRGGWPYYIAEFINRTE